MKKTLMITFFMTLAATNLIVTSVNVNNPTKPPLSWVLLDLNLASNIEEVRNTVKFIFDQYLTDPILKNYQKELNSFVNTKFNSTSFDEALAALIERLQSCAKVLLQKHLKNNDIIAVKNWFTEMNINPNFMLPLDVDTDYSNDTPLTFTLRNNDYNEYSLATLELLFQLGADPNYTPKQPYSHPFDIFISPEKINTAKNIEPYLQILDLLFEYGMTLPDQKPTNLITNFITKVNKHRPLWFSHEFPRLNNEFNIHNPSTAVTYLNEYANHLENMIKSYGQRPNPSLREQQNQQHYQRQLKYLETLAKSTNRQ